MSLCFTEKKLYVPAIGAPENIPTPFDIVHSPTDVDNEGRSTHTRVRAGRSTYTGAVVKPNMEENNTSCHKMATHRLLFHIHCMISHKQ